MDFDFYDFGCYLTFIYEKKDSFAASIGNNLRTNKRYRFAHAAKKGSCFNGRRIYIKQGIFLY